MNLGIKVILVFVITTGLVSVVNGGAIYRNYQFDLDDLSYSIQSDGITKAAYISMPISDPFLFAAAGDQLVTTVTFAGGQRLELISGLGATETVQLQYIGPLSSTQGTRSTQVFELLGVSGDYRGLPTYKYKQGFICGNCLSGFTTGGELTDAFFTFSGVRMSTTVDELFAGGPYSAVWLTATASDFRVRQVPEPSMLLLFLVGLVGFEYVRRMRETRHLKQFGSAS